MQLQVPHEVPVTRSPDWNPDSVTPPDHEPGVPAESVHVSVLAPDHVPQYHGVRGGGPR